MDFFSLKFFLYLLISLLIFYLSPPPYRAKYVFPAMNHVFLVSFSNGWASLLPLFIFLCAGFIAIQWIKKCQDSRIFILCVLVVTGIFVYLKKYTIFSFFPSMPYFYVTVGLSYILFRLLQILVDVHQGAIKEKISGIDFFNFTCNFLTFVSGPIQRYQEYQQQKSFLGGRVLSEGEVVGMFFRIIKGVMKTIVISGIFLNLHQYSLSGLRHVFESGAQWVLCRKYLLAALYYTLYLYYNFSGYMDMVIGIGGLFGARIPENFNKPFEATSFLGFWSRWHMTLSEWFKIYVFNPFLSLLVRQWDNPRWVPYYSVVAFFLTFFLMGIWHGSTAIFIIYGLFLGLGMSMNQLFDIQMRRYARVSYKKLISYEWVRTFSAALTYSYFSIGLSCLWLNFHELSHLWMKVKVSGFLMAWILGTGIISVVLWTFKIVKFSIRRLKEEFQVLLQNFYVAYAVMALQIFLIAVFWFQWLCNLPEFVYKGF